MNSENNEDIDELTQFLLNKCEVTSLNQFYHKWVQEIDHSVPVKNICAIHKNFNEEKVLKDIASIEDLIIINIPDYTQKQDLTREHFIIDSIGLGKILKSLKRLRIIKKKNPLSDIIAKLGIEKDRQDKFLNLINKAIEKRALYANLIKIKENRLEDQLYLKLYNKIKHPDYRGDFLKLIFTLILLIISLVVWGWLINQ